MANRKLVDLDVFETSGVDRAAHLHDGFLVMKNAKDNDRVKTQLLTALGKSKEDDLSSIQEQIDLAVAKAVAEGEAQVADLQAALEAAKNQAADLALKLEELQALHEGEESAEKTSHMGEEKKGFDEPDMEDVPEEVAKSLRSLPQDQREAFAKAFKAQAEQVAKATEEIRKERDIRLDSEAIAKSKETFKSIGIDHTSIAPAMRRLAEINPELAKTVESVLMATEAQATEGGLLKEFGSTSTSTASVIDEARSLAKAMVENGSAKTIELGIEKVFDSNPELAKRYAQEVSR